MNDIAHNLKTVQTKIDKVASQWKVDASHTHIIAVSKKQPKERIEAMFKKYNETREGKKKTGQL